MVKTKKQRPKHIPQRTCVGCRQIMSKRSLIRIVKSPEGVQVDLSGKAHGRGAYLHADQGCWERGINGALNHALNTKLTDQEKKDLREYFESHFTGRNQMQEGAEETS